MMTRENLLTLVPQVLRARGWRLYTERRRLVDLWQYGGRAVLGHNPSGLLRSIKNNAQRSLYAPYPHFAEERFCKALAALLPCRVFRIYESSAALHEALKTAGITAAVWRPFLDKESHTALLSKPVLAPVLPCPFPGAPAVLALDPQNADNTPEKLPPSQILSPVTLAAAARCVYDLLAVPPRATPLFAKVDKAVKNSKTWKRQGIYLNYTGAIADQNTGSDELFNTYAAQFRHFLEAGFLLPPMPEEPAILPGELSPGEEAKLARAFSPHNYGIS